MHYLELFFSGIIILALFIFFILYLSSFINSVRYKVPQVGTFSSDFKVMRKGLGKYKLSGKKIADLGSGSGKVLRFFEKVFGMRVTGYEIDFSNVIISKSLNYIFGNNAKIIKGNYLKEDLKEYDVIYVYGFDVLMTGIEDKLWGECSKGTLVISNAFKMPKIQPIEILLDDKLREEVYIYQI